MRKESVVVLHERIGGERESGHLEPAFERPLVQHLDVLRDELELEAARVHASRDEPPGHEGVVRIRRMADADAHEGQPSAGSGAAVALLGREHQAKGRTRSQRRLVALARARVDPGAA